MNLIPKANAWAMKGVQMIKMSSTAGSSGGSGSGGWTPGEHRDIFADKSSEAKKTEDASALKDNEPGEAPKDFTNLSHESPVAEAPCDPLYLMAQKKALQFDKKGKGINKEIVEHLRSYFDDQIIYYKTLANYNKSAMKRVKKVKKNWNKLLE